MMGDELRVIPVAREDVSAGGLRLFGEQRVG